MGDCGAEDAAHALNGDIGRDVAYRILQYPAKRERHRRIGSARPTRERKIVMMTTRIAPVASVLHSKATA